MTIVSICKSKHYYIEYIILTKYRVVPLKSKTESKFDSWVGGGGYALKNEKNNYLFIYLICIWFCRGKQNP